MNGLPMKPCPFCGEYPTMQPWHGGLPTKKLITCTNASFYDEDGGCSVGPSVTGETEEEAVASWNRRAGTEPVAEVLERDGFVFSIFPEAFHRIHIGDKLYTQPPAHLQDATAAWRPISDADKSIAYFHHILGNEELRIGNSYPIWVRDADGRTYEALWSDNGRQAYWWDIEGESPVSPVEFMPHPLSVIEDKKYSISEIEMLQGCLNKLVVANPEKALLAALDDEMRMWFVAQLTAIASARVQLTEIEAMVSRHLMPAKGGEA